MRQLFCFTCLPFSGWGLKLFKLFCCFTSLRLPIARILMSLGNSVFIKHDLLLLFQNMWAFPATVTLLLSLWTDLIMFKNLKHWCKEGFDGCWWMGLVPQSYFAALLLQAWFSSVRRHRGSTDFHRGCGLSSHRWGFRYHFVYWCLR